MPRNSLAISPATLKMIADTFLELNDEVNLEDMSHLSGMSKTCVYAAFVNGEGAIVRREVPAQGPRNAYLYAHADSDIVQTGEFEFVGPDTRRTYRKPKLPNGLGGERVMAKLTAHRVGYSFTIKSLMTATNVSHQPIRETVADLIKADAVQKTGKHIKGSVQYRTKSGILKYTDTPIVTDTKPATAPVAPAVSQGSDESLDKMIAVAQQLIAEQRTNRTTIGELESRNAEIEAILTPLRNFAG